MNRFAQSKKALENNKTEDAVEVVETISDAQIEEKPSQPVGKRKNKAIEYNMGIPLVKKNLQLPIELELAIKELKAKRNSARPVTREKLVTEEIILIEALEYYFSQPGINQEVLDYVLDNRMKYLASVGRGE